MRFDLASPASFFFFLLVPFLAPIIIAQQHHANGDAVHLDPRAAFLGPMTLVKNGAPPGLGRDHHVNEVNGAGGKDPSVFEVKSEHYVRSGSLDKVGPINDILQRGGQAIPLDLRKDNVRTSPPPAKNFQEAINKVTTSSRRHANLTPEEFAQRVEEARKALTAVSVGAVKAHRPFDDAKEVS